LYEEYATEIARDLTASDNVDKAEFVTKFDVRILFSVIARSK
jgi:hypothetical protein